MGMGLRNPRDLRVVGFTALHLALWSALLASRPTFWSGLAWVAIYSLVAFHSQVLNHAHMHYRLFRRRAGNAALDLAFGVIRGVPSHQNLYVHSHNHHRHHNSTADWTTSAFGGEGPNGLRIARYFVRMSAHVAREKAKARDCAILRRIERVRRREWIWQAVVFVGMGSWNPVALGLYLLGATLGIFWLVGLNFVLHDGCPAEATERGSRNFTGRALNYWLVNAGYHSIHHLAPSLHWSEIDRLVNERDPRVSELTYAHPSLLAFLKDYLIRSSPRKLAFR